MWRLLFSHSILFNLLETPSTNPPGSSAHGISQARILEWIAISSSRVSTQSRDQTHVSCVSYIGMQILYHSATWEAPYMKIQVKNISKCLETIIVWCQWKWQSKSSGKLTLRRNKKISKNFQNQNCQTLCQNSGKPSSFNSNQATGESRKRWFKHRRAFWHFNSPLSFLPICGKNKLLIKNTISGKIIFQK